jgi:integrase
VAIERFTPRTVSGAAAAFARKVTAQAEPESPNRAKAFLFAASRLGAFGETVGLPLETEVLLTASVIERLCHPETTAMSAPTRRTVRTNLRALARRVRPEAPIPALGRERAKAPYSRAEIAHYLALADAQGTEGRRQRASALVSLSAGAGLVGADLKAVRGTDVSVRSGGVVVSVRSGRRPRVVPVLWRYHDRLLSAAGFAGDRLVIGGTSSERRNVTSPLTASLAGGRDLPRIEIARLRATWLCEVAGMIGLRAFMDAAGITCSQRLGDLVGMLSGVETDEAVALLGARR